MSKEKEMYQHEEQDKSKKSRSWAFTLNNYTEEDMQLLKDIECKFIVFGKEIGEKGTPHLQGHIIFNTQYRLSQLKKTFGNQYHWGIPISEDHSINYCMKDKDYYIKNDKKQGHRTDIDKVVHSIKTVGIAKTIDLYPREYIKFHSGMEKLAYKCQPRRNFKPYIEWIWGPTGIGKTRYVMELEDPDCEGKLWISGKNLKWWEGYEQQEATLFDDFRGDFCTFHELLRILDRYPYTVEVKGGSRQLCSKRMYITSCYRPEDVYETREDIEQLLRRIDKITHMSA